MKRPMHMKLLSASMAFFTLTSVGVGCGGPMDSGSGEPSSNMTRRMSLNGRDLYKGMVFGVGPAARHFDELWQRPEVVARMSNPEVQAKREAAAETIAAKIQQMDPTFFDRFGSDLRSGNHLIIDRLLTELKDKTQAAAAALREEAGLPVGAASVEQIEAGTWFYVETVVAAVVAAVVTILVTQIDVTPVMESSQASALRRDIWVDMLASKSFDEQ